MKKPQRPQKTMFTSIFGSTIVYTPRHINRCQLRDRNSNGCSCPKWIYLRPRGGQAVQRAARTPSFTEACAEAQRVLRSFDPEIAAAREVNEPKPGIGIEACIDLYKAALERRSLSSKYLRNCMLPFKRRDPKEYEKKGRAKNQALLDYLDGINLAAREPVTRMEQLKSSHLDEWTATWKTNDLSTHVWRGLVTTFLKWAHAHDHVDREPEFREPHRVKAGNRCGYFTDEQIAKLRQALPFYRMKGHRLPENFAARMGAFIDLGREGGMALCDIVLFSPRLNLSDNNVLCYRRHKSGEIASVLLDPSVASRLRSIPPEDGSSRERPFRFPATQEEGNRHLWGARFRSLCDFAGVTEIETEHGGKRTPHCHALRDSCAIGALLSGVALENVSKMLGHSTSQTTEKKYLFWTKQRLDRSIEDQRLALGRRAAVAQEP